MQQLAEAHAQECCARCLNSGLSHRRSGGDEGRKWLHVYIAELSFSPHPPWCLTHFLFKHSQVREMTPAGACVHSSASALHADRRHFCLSLQAWMMDTKIKKKKQTSTKPVFLGLIYHIETQGKDNKRAVKADEEMEGASLL